MVRPGLKRLQQAQRVKVQPNKTGTSFMLGQSVYLRGAQHNNIAGGKLLKKGVTYDSNGNTPYNNLPQSKHLHQLTHKMKKIKWYVVIKFGKRFFL